MRKKSIIWVLLTIAIVIVIGGGLSLWKFSKKTSELTKVSLRLKWAMLASVAGGELIAIEKGYFREADLM